MASTRSLAMARASAEEVSERLSRMYSPGADEVRKTWMEVCADAIDAAIRIRVSDAEHEARVAAESNASKAGSAAYKLEGLLDRERKARVAAERERDRLQTSALTAIKAAWRSGYLAAADDYRRGDDGDEDGCCDPGDYLDEAMAALTDTGPKECDHEPVMVGGVGDLLNPPNNRRVCRKCGRPM